MASPEDGTEAQKRAGSLSLTGKTERVYVHRGSLIANFWGHRICEGCPIKLNVDVN
jgi:hypothetical protein